MSIASKPAPATSNGFKIQQRYGEKGKKDTTELRIDFSIANHKLEFSDITIECLEGAVTVKENGLNCNPSLYGNVWILKLESVQRPGRIRVQITSYGFMDVEVFKRIVDTKSSDSSRVTDGVSHSPHSKSKSAPVLSSVIPLQHLKLNREPEFPILGKSILRRKYQQSYFDGDLSWSPQHVSFNPGTIYTASIVICAKSEYLFPSEITAEMFTGLNGNESNILKQEISLSEDRKRVDITIRYAEIGKKPIPSLQLEGIGAPHKGAKPAGSVKETNCYWGTVTWKPAHSTFGVRTAYSANIVLKAKPGYEFAVNIPEEHCKIYGTSVTPKIVSNNMESIELVFCFPAIAEAIPHAPLVDISLPVAGDFPKTEISVLPYFTGKVRWEREVAEPYGMVSHTGSFAGGAVYHSVVELLAQDGYEFDDSSRAEDFNAPSSSSSWTGKSSKSSREFTFLFPPAEAKPEYVPDMLFRGLIGPTIGETPITEMAESKYVSGDIAWSPSDHKTFQPGGRYAASITIKPINGYVFHEDASIYSLTDMVVKNKVRRELTGGVLTFTVEFDALDQWVQLESLKAITPKLGEQPLTRLNLAGYTCQMTWTPNPMSIESGKFIKSEPYQVTINISAKDGYVFNMSIPEEEIISSLELPIGDSQVVNKQDTKLLVIRVRFPKPVVTPEHTVKELRQFIDSLTSDGTSKRHQRGFLDNLYSISTRFEKIAGDGIQDPEIEAWVRRNQGDIIFVGDCDLPQFIKGLRSSKLSFGDPISYDEALDFEEIEANLRELLDAALRHLSRLGIEVVKKNIGDVVTNRDRTDGWVTRNEQGLLADKDHREGIIYEMLQVGIKVKGYMVLPPIANIFSH